MRWVAEISLLLSLLGLGIGVPGGIAGAQDNGDGGPLPVVDFDDPNFGLSGAEAAEAIAAATAVAMAQAEAVQRTVDQTIVEGGLPLETTIIGSFNDNRGLVSVNQSTGDSNSQANVRAIALADRNVRTLELTDVNAAMDLRGNALVASGSRRASISGSFNESVGILGVNQASGSLNQQLNVLALAFGQSTGHDASLLNNALLSGVDGGGDNTLTEDGPVERQASLSNSFGDFKGIVQGSQIAGDLNQVGNLLAVNVRTVGAP
jgi:hypothetical protein